MERMPLCVADKWSIGEAMAKKAVDALACGRVKEVRMLLEGELERFWLRVGWLTWPDWEGWAWFRWPGGMCVPQHGMSLNETYARALNSSDFWYAEILKNLL
jgi:hypothetical protein